MPDPEKKKPEEEVVVTPDNAAEVARKELEAERLAEDPNYKPKDVPAEPPSGDADLPPEGEPKDPPPEGKTEDELLKANDDDLNDEEKETKKGIIEANEAEEERVLAIKEEELTPEDKTKKDVILLEREGRQRAAFDEQVKVYAEDKGIGIDDAKKALESIGKIKEKYGSDPFKIAESNRDLQRLISKKDEDIKNAKEESLRPRTPQSADEWEHTIKANGLVLASGKPIDWKEAATLYRKENEGLTENLEDEQVLKLVANGIHTRLGAHREKVKVETRTKANERRADLLKKIPEDDKRFEDEISALLKTVPDGAILDENYDLEPSLRYARGGFYTKATVDDLVKQAELRGFEKGKTKGVIVTGPVGAGGQPKSKSSVTISPKELDEAWEMFPQAKDDKEASEMFLDLKAHRAESKKKK